MLPTALLVAALCAAFGHGLSLNATVATGRPTPVPCAAELVFKPATSSASPSACTLTADVGGDYVLAASGVSTWIKAIDWKAHDANPHANLLFADAFSGHGGVASTETLYNVWDVEAGATATEGDGTLVIASASGSSPGGIMTQRADNVFEEPVVMNMSDVVIGEGHLEATAEFFVASKQDAVASIGARLVRTSATEYTVFIVVQDVGGNQTVLGTATAPCSAPSLHAVRVAVNATQVKASLVCTEATPPVVVSRWHHVGWTKFAAVGGVKFPKAVSQLALRTTGKASLGPLAIERQLPWHTLRDVLYPQPGSISLTVQDSLGTVAAEAESMGYVDVTKAPFYADASGAADSTAALQRGIDYAYANGLVLWLPAGEYMVSDTLNCTQRDRLGGIRQTASYVLGAWSASGKRAVIKLRDSTPGFTDVQHPKYVIHFVHIDDQSAPKPNVNFNQVINRVDVDLGTGNAGAIGIRHRAAQGSSIQDVTVYANDALSGVEGGAGSGGSHIAVTVIGGRWGAQYRQTQPAATLSGWTLVNQTCAGILYCGINSLSVVGTSITAGGSASSSYRAVLASGTCDSLASSGPCAMPAFTGNNPQAGGGAISGQLSLVDTVLEAGNASTAVWTASNQLYMRRVYAKGFDTVAFMNRTNRNVTPEGSPGLWTVVDEVVYGVPSPPHYDEGQKWTLGAPSYVDGHRSETTTVRVGPGSPPADTVSQYQWGPAFPTFDMQGVVNVKDAPYHAAGDGMTDDRAALQAALDGAPQGSAVVLPRGQYAVGGTLVVPAGRQVVGVAHHMVAIVPTYNMSGPLLRTAGGPPPQGSNNTLDTVVAEVSFFVYPHTPAVTTVDWQAEGPRSVYRQGAQWINSDVCSMQPTLSWCPPSGTFEAPLFTVTGEGRGLFYVMHFENDSPQSATYRHLRVSATGAGPRRFLHLNAEHAESGGNFEVSDADNVDIFGMKSEGLHLVGLFSNVRNVSMYGYGGNACPSATGGDFGDLPASVFRVTGTASGLSLVCLVQYDSSGTLPLPSSQALQGIPCPAPDTWISVFSSSTSLPANVSTAPLDRPVLFRIN